jgi:hypothetical protein
LVDIEKNRIVWSEDFGDSFIIYDSDWSVQGVLAVAGTLKEVVFRKFDGKSQSFTKLKGIMTADFIRCC